MYTLLPLAVELWASSYGLKLAWLRGFGQVILETDSAVAAEALGSAIIRPSRYSNLIWKCLNWVDRNQCDCRVVHVRREANQCADWLATIP